MRYIVLILITCLSPLESDAESFSYDESVRFVQERSEEKIAAEKAIFCLGPEQVEELYSDNGKEEKKIARLARSFDFETNKTAGRLLLNTALLEDVSYEVSIYRCEKKDLLVRIKGVSHELYNSQFPLKSGDLVVIQRVVRVE
jgi:hypothetical protein